MRTQEIQRGLFETTLFYDHREMTDTRAVEIFRYYGGITIHSTRFAMWQFAARGFVVFPYLGPEMIELLLQWCDRKDKPQIPSKPRSIHPNPPSLVLDDRVDEEDPGIGIVTRSLWEQTRRGNVSAAIGNAIAELAGREISGGKE